MRFDSVSDWLAYQESLNTKSIDLGLERVQAVYQRLTTGAQQLEIQQPSAQFDPQWRAVITVAGTNGKGSCVAMLTSILTESGLNVGSYTSPHLFRYNERICINRQPVEDAELCRAFEIVEQVRGEIPLTYFEFGTLAALVIFARQPLDAIVLEVGLGGRLDAVNIIDPDVALITAIDVDHVDWLGDNRESIAKEKAGIMRQHKPMVCVDPNPPESLKQTAKQLSVPAYYIADTFSCRKLDETTWCWSYGGTEMTLPNPTLAGDFQLQNAAGVVMTLELLKDVLPLREGALAAGLKNTVLAARFQLLPDSVTRIFDVAHNTQAAKELAKNLTNMACAGRTHAVLAMLKDKAIDEVVAAMLDVVDDWYVADLAVPRGACADEVAKHFPPGAIVSKFNEVQTAYQTALSNAVQGDRVVVFGSFYTVAEAMPQLGNL